MRCSDIAPDVTPRWDIYRSIRRGTCLVCARSVQFGRVNPHTHQRWQVRERDDGLCRFCLRDVAPKERPVMVADGYEVVR